MQIVEIFLTKLNENEKILWEFVKSKIIQLNMHF